jgi:hypothetical protein
MISCNKTSENKNTTKDTTVVQKDSIAENTPKELLDYQGKPVTINPQYDNFARFIACMPVKDNKFDSLLAGKTWQELSHADDSIWQHLEANRFSKMRDFASVEFKDFVSVEKNVLYPFSGPDFVNAFTFFPKGKTYTMVALEPVGEFVDFTKKNNKYVNQYLYDVNTALNDLYKKSYFITSHMGGHLQKHRANGTLPLISIFMVRTGNKILNVQKVLMDSTGNYTLDTLDSKTRIVRVDFVNEKNLKDVKSLFYFQADMTDAGLKKTKGLVPFMKKFDNCIGYYKSASYCCFDPVFTTIKNTMLEKCDFLVQDDTGIPFSTFNKNKNWAFTLYGAYEKPVKDFGSYTHQNDLAAAFKDSNNVIKPLPFSLGYHWQTKNQNLMLFKKVK